MRRLISSCAAAATFALLTTAAPARRSPGLVAEQRGKEYIASANLDRREAARSYPEQNPRPAAQNGNASAARRETGRDALAARVDEYLTRSVFVNNTPSPLLPPFHRFARNRRPGSSGTTSALRPRLASTSESAMTAR